MFDHCPPKELLELETEAIAGKRHYITPSGSYPSITTILSAFPKPELMEWKKRVGEAEANRISSLATSRGTKIHSLCEQYLLNEEINSEKMMLMFTGNGLKDLNSLNKWNEVPSIKSSEEWKSILDV